MTHLINEIGNRYGRLLVIDRAQRVEDKVKWAEETLRLHKPGALAESPYGYC